MLKARQGKEVVVRIANKVGELAKLTKVVAERGVNVLAASAWVEDAEAVIRLVTDDTLRTMDVLRDNDYKPQERSVVLVDAAHKPGILYAVKVGDLQWVRIPPGQSVARPEATRAAKEVTTCVEVLW